MSTSAIEEQLITIKKASKKAAQTEQSALEFLIEAGLIEASASKPIKASPKK